MGAGGAASDLRRVQRALEQLRADVGKMPSAEAVAAVEKRLAALEAQVGSLADRDGDGLPDALDLDGGSA